MNTVTTTVPAGLAIGETTVDLVVVGSGTGLAAALAAHEEVLSVLVVEKSGHIGGSTARSGGALWLPASSVIAARGERDSRERAGRYLQTVVAQSNRGARTAAFLDNIEATISMLHRRTPMRLFWAKDYSDYHPEADGGSAVGRTCECRPLDSAVLGEYLPKLQPGVMEAKLPMPTTGADYRWLNLMSRVPHRGLPILAKRLAQGIGGLLLGRRYVAGGQALAAGLFAGVLEAGIPIWTETSLSRIIVEDGRATGVVLSHGGTEVVVTARRGIILAAGGFDHDMEMRRKFQSQRLGENESLGAQANTGDAIRAAQDVGAALDSMDQAWWFPAVAPLPGAKPLVMLAERALPGSLIVDQTGNRFINEATDYMTFGQRILELESSGDPVDVMWIVFDKKYRNSYVFAADIFPRAPLPKSWYEAGIAHHADTVSELAAKIGVDRRALEDTVVRYNQHAHAGVDSDFHRGASAYDRYYGDPTVKPNPNLRPLDAGPYYAVRMVLSDLGTCGGLQVDEKARVLNESGAVIEGLYAVGNTAANAFGSTYPGAGATIAQGLVFARLAALDAAGR